MLINNEIILSPEILIKIVDWMSQGMTPVQVAAKIGISKQKLTSLVARPENEDLREQMDLGMTKFEAYMEDVGQQLIGAKSGKESVWKEFMMKYFNWNNKTEVKVNDDWIKNASDEELKELVKTNLELGLNKKNV